MAGQRALFNFQRMASTKAIRKLHRERARNAIAPQPEVVRYKVISMPINEIEGEFLLPDEERYWNLTKLHPCHVCGMPHPRMLRKCDAPSPTGRLLTNNFSIQCCAKTCGFTTPEFTQSREAIQHWQVLGALVKL